MIPYRRQRAIETGAPSLLAADIAPGDIVLIRRPSAVERTPEKVTRVVNHKGGWIALHFAGFIHETSRNIPLAVTEFTAGTWRQH